jgi:mannose-6-phosphate isomerase-like protein (cupin superfamily)
VAEESSQPKFVTAGPREGRSVWLMGARYTFKVTGKQTGGSYGTVEAEVPPGYGAPPHVHHREDESFYVIEGDIAFVCGGKSFVAKPGTFLHVPRGMPHEFKNNSESPVRMLVTYSPAGFEQFFERAGTTAVPGDAPPHFDLEEELRRVLAAAPEFHLEFRVPEPPRAAP